MRHCWWWFRLALLTCVFVGLGGYLFATTPWRRWLGLQTDFTPQIAEGDRLVGGILEFRATHGLWPQYLEDVPEAATKPLQFPWYYDVSTVTDAEGRTLVRPSLSTRAGTLGARSHLGYDFDPETPAWKVFGDVEPTVLRRGLPANPPVATAPGPATGPSGLRGRALAELDRRIDREPTEVEHWRAKAGLLVTGEAYADARALVEEAAQELPGSYWPRMAKAALDLQAARDPLPASVTAFGAWVKEKPSMTRWYYLSVLYRLAGRPGEAADAMKQAAACEVTVGPDDPNVAAYYLWDMARWSLAAGRHEVTAAVCDAWSAALEEGTLSDQSFIPLRAAAQLAAGEPTAADTLARLKPGSRHWAKHLDALQAAIEKGDRAFRYDPGRYPAEFEIFPVPE